MFLYVLYTSSCCIGMDKSILLYPFSVKHRLLPFYARIQHANPKHLLISVLPIILYVCFVLSLSLLFLSLSCHQQHSLTLQHLSLPLSFVCQLPDPTNSEVKSLLQMQRSLSAKKGGRLDGDEPLTPSRTQTFFSRVTDLAILTDRVPREHMRHLEHAWNWAHGRANIQQPLLYPLNWSDYINRLPK